MIQDSDSYKGFSDQHIIDYLSPLCTCISHQSFLPKFLTKNTTFYFIALKINNFHLTKSPFTVAAMLKKPAVKM